MLFSLPFKHEESDETRNISCVWYDGSCNSDLYCHFYVFWLLIFFV